jgi:hypothetical protein
MGLLEEMEQEENPPEDETNNEGNAPSNNADGLEVSSLEVAGVIIDDYGNRWQVPGDNVTDLDDLYAGDIYKIPKELEAKFFVQMIRVEQLKEYTLRHFVPVLQEELGIPKELVKDMGHPLDRYHVVGDSIMVKIPHEIRNMIEARKVRETKQRLLNLEPTEEMVKRAGVDAGMMIEHKLGFTGADPAKRQGIFVDEKGKEKR